MTVKKHSRLTRLIAAALSIVILMSLVPASVLAASPTAQIAVGEVFATPGATVSLNIIIDENPGISSLLLNLEYPEVLTLAGVESGYALSNLDFTAPAQLTSPCKLLWDSLDAESSNNGILLTAIFAVSEDAVPGEDYAVSVSCRRGDAVDSDMQTVQVATASGTVHVIEFLPGDVNSDGRVNGTDVSLLRRYIAGGYGITINQSAADVNADGRLNGTDISWIRRNVTGGYDVTLKPAKPQCDHTNLTAVGGRVPGCTTEGNIAHWFCPDCGEYFDSADADNALTAEEVFVPATGHTEVVDSAVAPDYENTGLTEGTHCSTCNEVLVAPQTVPVLEPTEHAIVYKNLGGAETPTVTSYAEHTGLPVLPVPERAGYRFVGWYTSTDYRKVVNYIPKGSTQDFVLFAKWAIETYTITYLDAPENPNVATYTTEDRIILDDPEWSGLDFTGWTNQDGNTVTEIPKGSSGDLELTANWRRLRNIATEGNTKGLLSTYDPVAERYYFIYELGIIEHVVLEEIAIGGTNLKYNSGASDLSFELSNSVTISEEIADEIANLVSESVSNSEEWEKSHEWGKESTNEHKVEVSVKAEFGIGPVKSEIEAGYGYTNTQSESWSDSSSQGGSTESGSTVEHESASTVAYMKEISSTVTTSITIERDMPTGYYSYVHAGNVRVFGIVTYDPAENTFYLDTYSMLDNMHEMMLYYRDYNELNEQTCESLSYGIPREEILEIIDSSYYLSFDGNGADGGSSLPMSMMQKDVPLELPDNNFTRTGYAFGGWAVGDRILEEGESVVNLGETGEVVVVKAVWIPITYTIKFDLCKPENAQMNVSYQPDPITVTYDQVAMLPEVAPTLEGYSFGGWLVVPGAVEPWLNLGLGGPTDEPPNLANENGDAVTLYAVWKPNSYTVSYDLSEYTSMYYAPKTVYYGEAYGELRDPSSYIGDNYFLGWIDEDLDNVTAETIVRRMYDHTLKVDAIQKSQQIALTGNHRIRVDADTQEYETHSLDNEATQRYLEAGCTKVEITVSFHVEEINDGYQEAYLWVGGTKIFEKTNYETSGSGTKTYTTECSLEAFLNAGSAVKLGWNAHGSLEDDWYVGDTTITFKFVP